MKVGILGGGESGVGAARLALKSENEVFLSEYGTLDESVRSELLQFNIPFEERGHTLERLDQSDVIVKSPGIPNEAEIVVALRQHGIPVISEIEWAARHCPGRILAITGSNGKTTTTMLCQHLLEVAGVDAVACGNVGTGFSRAVAESAHDWYVVEVSSFQLDDIDGFRPEIGIILNITPDHLNRYHGDLMAYAHAKMRMAEFMQPSDVLICNGADPLIMQLLETLPTAGRVIKVTAADGAPFGLPSEALPGMHNALNGACAIAAIRQIGIDAETIRGALQTFSRPEHRMEEVAVIDGVRYINDSKATNVDSVFYALDAIKGPVIWIAGGQDKGNDYSQLYPLLGKVKRLICLGIDNKNLLQAFSSRVDYIEETTNMFEAVAMAASNSSSGDTVLLSPACASFDLFKNYMHRGALFREAVLKLRQEE